MEFATEPVFGLLQWHKLFRFKPSCYQHGWLVDIEILESCAHISLNYKSEVPKKNTNNICNWIFCSGNSAENLMAFSTTYTVYTVI